MRSIFFAILIISLINASLSAQPTGKVNLLYKFMQDNSDTTIVVELAGNWVTDAPSINLLSKKGDTLTSYTYRDLVYQRSGILIPNRIRGEMRKENRLKILITEIDVNEFLNVSEINQKTLKALWNKIMREKPWTLLDDQVEGQGCGVTSKSNAYISDDGGQTYI